MAQVKGPYLPDLAPKSLPMGVYYLRRRRLKFSARIGLPGQHAAISGFFVWFIFWLFLSALPGEKASINKSGGGVRHGNLGCGENHAKIARFFDDDCFSCGVFARVYRISD
ncbi:MAG: hypothetical protein NWT12_14745 [Paracoccaceae bacterium]|nr:hypothetical protein [Paracoccaceae bacterium]MDP5367540.1 hypothetical protein [Paracoccaceae bacterium]